MFYSRCGPRLNAEAADKLKRRYVMMRSGSSQHERETDKKSAIPITVRQLEAVIRISESLAKMQLLPFASEVHVNEALRLFQVSTLDAAMSGSLAGLNLNYPIIFSFAVNIYCSSNTLLKNPLVKCTYLYKIQFKS